jgi:hypothetical protein
MESNISLKLIGFENEQKGQSKSDWIKENASDFDIVIDDNPSICRSLVNNIEKEELLEEGDNVAPFFDEDDLGPPPKTILDDEKPTVKSTLEEKGINTSMKIIAPYYPAIEKQHDESVLLVKQEVSDLKKEDF